MISRFSAGSALMTFSRCSFQVLPTSVQTGAKQSASSASASSSEAFTSRRRVMPKAQIVELSNLSFSSRPNSSTSFGLELGKPASM